MRSSTSALIVMVVAALSWSSPSVGDGDVPTYRVFLNAPILFTESPSDSNDAEDGEGSDNDDSTVPEGGVNYPGVSEINRTTEYDSQACGAGYTGNQIRSREIVLYSDGSEEPLPWSAWSSADCQPVVETGRTTETESRACAAGSTGQQKRTRTKISYSDGSIVYSEWSTWDAGSCSPTIVKSMIRKSYQLIGCGGSLGARVQVTSTPYYLYANGTQGSGTATTDPGTCKTNTTLRVYNWSYGGCLFGTGHYSRTEYWVNRYGEYSESSYTRMTAGCEDVF